MNKKVIDLKGKDVRKAVPKGMSYFVVDFGMQSGFAHIIEDEQRFPPFFAQVTKENCYTKNRQLYIFIFQGNLRGYPRP